MLLKERERERERERETERKRETFVTARERANERERARAHERKREEREREREIQRESESERERQGETNRHCRPTLHDPIPQSTHVDQPKTDKKMRGRLITCCPSLARRASLAPSLALPEERTIQSSYTSILGDI